MTSKANVIMTVVVKVNKHDKEFRLEQTINIPFDHFDAVISGLKKQIEAMESDVNKDQ